MSEHVDAVIEHKAAGVCSACHSPLEQQEVIERRQVFELPAVQLRVIEHRHLRARCTCGAVHEGTWPQGINAPTQYGASLKAFAVELSQQHRIPLGRVCELMGLLAAVRGTLVHDGLACLQGAQLHARPVQRAPPARAGVCA